MARRIARVVSTLVVAAGLLFGALLVQPAALGWQRYIITSGSMTGTYDRGSLVLDEVVPVGDLRNGDVITYRPPAGSGPAGLVTHRIAAITTDKLGRKTFRTKGDANESADPWTFALRFASPLVRNMRRPSLSREISAIRCVTRPAGPAPAGGR